MEVALRINAERATPEECKIIKTSLQQCLLQDRILLVQEYRGMKNRSVDRSDTQLATSSVLTFQAPNHISKIPSVETKITAEQNDFFSMVQLINTEALFSDVPELFLDAYLVPGVDINAFTGTGETMLMLATKSGNLTLITALLERGANPQLLNPQGYTALELAEQLGHDAEVLEALTPKKSSWFEKLTLIIITGWIFNPA